MITAGDYILMSNIIEEANSIKNKGHDISKLVFVKKKKEPIRTLKDWCREFDEIRIMFIKR